MLRRLLICGLVAGVCAGLLATGFASLAGEPALDQAIAYEDAQDHAAMPAGHHEAPAPAPVSRGAQKTVGLLTASVVYGIALGGLFALAFAFAYGRVARAGPRNTAYGLAAAAFVVVYFVPFLKYPASPPGATDPATIGKRTLLYATMVAISLLAAVAASRLRPALLQRFGAHAANLGAGLAYAVVVLAAGLTLPSIREIPSAFPATALWSFREASIGMQAVTWLTIGLVFGPLAQRAMSGQPIAPWRGARRERVDAQGTMRG
jgi:predicted cobalt transporter CbtA